MSFAEEYQDLILRLERDATLDTKRALLDLLCNSQFYDTPDGTMQVQVLDRQTHRATKWKPWLEVRENEWWVQNCNNRSIGVAEVVFDLDPRPDETSEQFEARIRAMKDTLIKKSAFILGDFTTGGRGRHIHVLLVELAQHRKRQVTELKHYILKRYGADLAKATTRSMILIEGSVNSKSGKRKRVMTSE